MESLTLFNKAYTVAFRLTGQAASGNDLALVALTVTAKEYGWQIKRLPLEMPQANIKEVYRLFLLQSWSAVFAKRVMIMIGSARFFLNLQNKSY